MRMRRDSATESPKAAAVPSRTELFLSFLSLGSTAFGGPAMVAYIRQMAVERKHWLDEQDFDNGVALCQAIPGATAMQMAAYVGLSVRGIAGAATSFVGFGLPAFGFMLALSALYGQTRHLPGVVAALNGLQTVVVAIIANAAISFGKSTLKTWQQAVIIATSILLFGFELTPFLAIAVCALLGLWLLSKQALRPAGLNTATVIQQTTKPVLLIVFGAFAILVFLFLLYRPLFQLALVMMRIDLFAFAGGFASVPLMFNQVARARQWLDTPTFMDGILLGQITPGPIVITATFVGYLLRGVAGAFVATGAIFLPSFLMLVLAAPHFNRLRGSPIFSKAIAGALCSFPGLLLIVAIQFARDLEWDAPHLVLAAAAFAALRLGTNILWVVMIGAVVSFLLFR